MSVNELNDKNDPKKVDLRSNFVQSWYNQQDNVIGKILQFPMNFVMMRQF